MWSFLVLFLLCVCVSELFRFHGLTYVSLVSIHRLAPAEAVPLLLRAGEGAAARALALQHREKMPELMALVSDVPSI